MEIQIVNHNVILIVIDILGQLVLLLVLYILAF